MVFTNKKMNLNIMNHICNAINNCETVLLQNKNLLFCKTYKIIKTKNHLKLEKEM